ncbi:PilW family protein [Aquabacterium parvum]|uniref:PilW family protein n=1 Tax=Aquabacterium parvum TaxID=70584 RepID=UPI0013665475|nr:PilW family protein [Aquabacterium parvum]
MHRERISSRGARRQSGVTLVELMVTIAINLVLVLAATLLYLNTRSTQREVNERSAVYETGQFAMGLLARDINSAGFYPAAAIEKPNETSAVPTDGVRFTYDTAVAGMGLTDEAYANGVFGCAGKSFDSKTRACVDSDKLPEGSDSLVLSYFTEDAFSLGAGQRGDCTRSDVITDTTVAKNDKRATYLTDMSGSGSGSGADDKGASKLTADKVKPDLGPLPDAPLLVINAYELIKDTLVLDDGREVPSSTLTCWGNGSGSRQPLVQGVEQFVVSYGLANDASRRPVRYVSAGVVGTQSANIDGELQRGWQLVTSIRVCMLVRSAQSTTLRDAPDVTDCRGESVSRANGVQVQRFEQVFSVKNRQGNTVPLKLAVAGGQAPDPEAQP